jgi:DNA polymerase-3 subunit alpha
VSRVKELGMNSIALTDHGYLSGSVQFYQECKNQGIKPIIGVETYLTPHSINLKDVEHKESYHLILLAKSLVGYRNLMKMMTVAATDGFYRFPRIDKELLAEYSEGLLCSTACLNSEVNSRLYNSKDGYNQVDVAAAAGKLGDYIDIFGKENVFVEIMYHGLDSQKQVAKHALKLASDQGVRVVATNDVHYIGPEDRHLRDIMMADRCNMRVDDPERKLRDNEGEYYIKSPDQMWSMWGEVDSSLLTNTLAIADMVEEYDPGVEAGHRLPKFSEESSWDIFARKVADGFSQKYSGADKGSTEYARLNHEIATIEQLGFRDYFLILADIIEYASTQGIPVGPGRGSAAGSIVAYCLDITTVCPIKYDLLFERFLNPERLALPDIDVDVCKEGRDQLIEYVREKYGADNVCQITTFNRVKGKGSLRLVGKALGIPIDDYERLSKLIPKDAADYSVTIGQIMGGDEDAPWNARAAFHKYARQGGRGKNFLESCLGLEGTNKSYGIHAGAVVIAPEKLTNILPLKLSKEGSLTTQVDMDDVEALGLLKLDLLGLDTLTAISTALYLIHENNPEGPLKDKSHVIGIRELQKEFPDLDDPTVYEKIFNNGRSIGTFQCESGGLRELLARMRAHKFTDIAAAIALYRPGPLDAGITDSFCFRRNGTEREESWHPDFDRYVSDTHALPIYQEQIMQASRVLCGFTMAQADKLRKVIGKKKKDEIAAFRSKFLEATKVTGKVTDSKASEIYDQIEKYGRYAFNKSHSVAYAVITFYTGWLKTYYPAYLMAAMMNKFCSVQKYNKGEIGKVIKKKDDEKIITYLWEAQRYGISVLKPDVTTSDYYFKVIETKGKPNITYGIGSLKAVGPKAKALIEWRNTKGGFQNVGHFLFALIQCGMNKTTAKELIEAGCVDFGIAKATLLRLVDGFRRPCRCTKKKDASPETTATCRNCKGEGLARTTKSILEDIKKIAKKYDNPVDSDMVKELGALFEGERAAPDTGCKVIETPGIYVIDKYARLTESNEPEDSKTD